MEFLYQMFCPSGVKKRSQDYDNQNIADIEWVQPFFSKRQYKNWSI